jgi:hypothetical protein
MDYKTYNIPIIYYHSIGPKNPKWVRNFLTLELPFFEHQLKYLSMNYQSISLKDFWEIRNGNKKPIENGVVLTFDDGYLDNWIWAYPLLKKYGMQATIFISPEFVDTISGVRPNLEDVWKGITGIDDICQWGFLTWEEMKMMEASGFINIESHTMSHTKYFVSDKLIGFHYPGADILYEVSNEFPERKPYYIEDREFEGLLPYGYPLFESKSAIIAHKVKINEDFIGECLHLLKGYGFSDYNFMIAFKQIEALYEKYQKEGDLIVHKESFKDYKKRLHFEIFNSKRIIEEMLDKEVKFLCWPHGDNNELAHTMAKEAGYLATSVGKSDADPAAGDRFSRLGSPQVRNNRLLTNLKLHYKIKSLLKQEPWYTISKTYHFVKYKI